VLHDADKKRVGNLRNDIRHHAEALMPVFNYNDIQTRNLRKWIQQAQAYQKRYAETMLFDADFVARFRQECRDMKESVDRLKVSCERFGDRVVYGIPEPATYDAEPMIAERGNRFSARILSDLDATMAYYSPLAVRLVKQGKSADEIVAAVEAELQAKHEKLLAERQMITETWRTAEQKFEAATTLDEMKTTVAEAKRIYDELLLPNTREIDRWRAHCDYLGFEELEKSGILPRESFPLNSMLIRVKDVEKRKLDVSDPAVRARLPPIR
jgi:hypothetical protein